MVYGLSAAVQGAITFADQQAVEQNFHDYEPLRMHTTPSFEVAILETNGSFGHIGGVGEPGTPPAAPVLANALFDLTGPRARELPLNRTFGFMTWPAISRGRAGHLIRGHVGLPDARAIIAGCPGHGRAWLLRLRQAG